MHCGVYKFYNSSVALFIYDATRLNNVVKLHVPTWSNCWPYIASVANLLHMPKQSIPVQSSKYPVIFHAHLHSKFQ